MSWIILCAEYLGGRTPNPCIACNRYVKWESLLEAQPARSVRITLPPAIMPGSSSCQMAAMPSGIL